MPFESKPLELIGPTSESRSHQAMNSLTKNWYPELSENGATFLPWLGAKAHGTSTGTLDRGTHKHNSIMYHVVDQTLWSVDVDGVETSIGTIEGTQRCIFFNSVVGSLDQMVICAGKIYTYDGTDLEDTGLTADSGTYLNSKSIYPSGGFNFAVTGASGPSSVTSTGSAESKPDDLRRPYAFEQLVYMFGTETIEPFFDAGTSTAGAVPLKRMDNAIMQKGLGGFYTIANTDQALYFLADDFNVYRMEQSQLTNITPAGFVNSIKALDLDKAEGYTMTYDKQDFYILRFDSGLSWKYMEKLDFWVNLSSGVDDGPYLPSSYIRVYDKDLAVDYNTGNTIELDDTTYTELGNVIQRRRVLPPINSETFGLAYGKRLTMSSITFALQKGVGIASGQGSNPKIMVQYSLDGNETWSTERWVEIGRMGKSLFKVKYDEMVSFYEISFRITISDPVFSSLRTASIDIKAGGY